MYCNRYGNEWYPNRYPEYEAHKCEHDELTMRVVGFQRVFLEGSATVSYELLDFLSEWITKHTMVVDRKYSSFLNRRGVF
ncbi:MAG: hemerythrin family protein [Planctomycetes bacterium]|nr:hemerythrin family protein [Planctomycetota bacterium]